MLLTSSVAAFRTSNLAIGLCVSHFCLSLCICLCVFLSFSPLNSAFHQEVFPCQQNIHGAHIIFVASFPKKRVQPDSVHISFQDSNMSGLCNFLILEPIIEVEGLKHSDSPPNSWFPLMVGGHWCLLVDTDCDGRDWHILKRKWQKNWKANGTNDLYICKKTGVWS